MANETNKRFTNRVSENPNRRELRIVSQTSDLIVADIYRADTVQNGEYGTPIDADVLNEWEERIVEAESKVARAESKAANATITSNNAVATVQQLTSNVDCSAANNVGTPSVEIKEIDGAKRFVFKNLKGATGGTEFIFNGASKNKVRFDLSGSVLTITTE